MNAEQIKSIIRYLLLTAGAALVEHNHLSSAHLSWFITWVLPVLLIAIPALWSLWSKTHAAQAKKAIEIVNTVEGIVGEAGSGQVKLLPGCSPKPEKADPAPAAAALILLAGLSSIGLSGCVSQSRSSTPSTWAVFSAAGLDFGIAEALPLVLDKNPALAPIVTGVADALPTVFGAGDLTPDSVAADIQSLGDRYPQLTPAVQKILCDVINKGVSAYEVAFKVQVASMTDPNVKEIISGISGGLQAGLKAWQAQNPQPSASADPVPLPILVLPAGEQDVLPHQEDLSTDTRT